MLSKVGVATAPPSGWSVTTMFVYEYPVSFLRALTALKTFVLTLEKESPEAVDSPC